MRKVLIYILLIIVIGKIYPQNIDVSKTHSVIVTYYHDRFEGRKTSNGERFSQKKYTAAHCRYKFGTLLLVTYNNSWVIVKVNDRCPKRGVLDLSKIAAKQLGILKKGTVNAKIIPLPDEYYEVWKKQDIIFESFDKNSAKTVSDIIEHLNRNISVQEKNNTKKPEQKKNDNTKKEYIPIIFE